jgi:hypothetical protein
MRRKEGVGYESKKETSTICYDTAPAPGPSRDFLGAVLIDDIGILLPLYIYIVSLHGRIFVCVVSRKLLSNNLKRELQKMQK